MRQIPTSLPSVLWNFCAVFPPSLGQKRSFWLIQRGFKVFLVSSSSDLLDTNWLPTFSSCLLPVSCSLTTSRFHDRWISGTFSGRRTRLVVRPNRQKVRSHLLPAGRSKLAEASEPQAGSVRAGTQIRLFLPQLCGRCRNRVITVPALALL